FRPHILDMFEPQDYPNDFAYPGGPPVAPYDAAGWTLAYQMGVEFDRFQDDFTGPFEAIPYGEVQKPQQSEPAGNGGYLLAVSMNDSFLAVNRLLKAGVEVSRVKKDRKSTRLNSSHVKISYAVFCLKKKKKKKNNKTKD